MSFSAVNTSLLLSLKLEQNNQYVLTHQNSIKESNNSQNSKNEVFKISINGEERSSPVLVFTTIKHKKRLLEL